MSLWINLDPSSNLRGPYGATQMSKSLFQCNPLYFFYHNDDKSFVNRLFLDKRPTNFKMEDLMLLSVENESSHRISPLSNYRSAAGAKEQLQFRFQNVNLDLKKWSEKSFKHNVNIIDLEKQLNEIDRDQPILKRNSLDFVVEIVLIYQNKMRCYFLCEIIRRNMLKYIEDLYALGKEHFERQLSELDEDDKNRRQKIHSKLNLVNQCHQFLVSLVPAQVSVLLPPEEYEENVELMKNSFRLIKMEAGKMQSKLG